MCARELNSEVATTGPCSEEAYWYGRCRAMESDVDVSILYYRGSSIRIVAKSYQTYRGNSPNISSFNVTQRSWWQTLILAIGAMLTMLKNMKITLVGIDLDSLAKKAALQILVDGCPCKWLTIHDSLCWIKKLNDYEFSYLLTIQCSNLVYCLDQSRSEISGTCTNTLYKMSCIWRFARGMMEVELGP